MKTNIEIAIDHGVNATITAVHAGTGIQLDDREAFDFFEAMGGVDEPLLKILPRGALLEFIAGEFVAAVLGRYIPSTVFSTADFEEFADLALALGYRFEDARPAWEITLMALSPMARSAGVPDYLVGIRREAFQQGGRA